MKGEVRIELLLEEDAVFERGRRVVLLRDAPPTSFETEIQLFRRQHGRCIARFRGIDSISEAEKYVGCDVKVEMHELPPLEEGWFYTFELKGCSVFAGADEYVGTVADVIDSGGARILAVNCDGAELLIPFAQAYMKRIDPRERRIDVELPEELRELNG